MAVEKFNQLPRRDFPFKLLHDWEPIGNRAYSIKLTAKNERLGLFIKMYWTRTEDFATRVARALAAMAQVTDVPVPVLVPVGVYDQTLVFPLGEPSRVIRAGVTPQQTNLYRSIYNNPSFREIAGQENLSLAWAFNTVEISRTRYLIDVFEDGDQEILHALGKTSF